MTKCLGCKQETILIDGCICVECMKKLEEASKPLPRSSNCDNCIHNKRGICLRFARSLTEHTFTHLSCEKYDKSYQLRKQ